MKDRHIPVLLQEVVTQLSPKSNQNFIDATVGLGGHASEILAHTGPNGLLIGIDQDKDALRLAQENLKQFGIRFKGYFGNFNEIIEASRDIVINGGILADLGVSSLQLDKAERGFSFRKEAELDMRMNQGQDTTARKVVNEYSEIKLKKIFQIYSNEKFAANIAKNICKNREVKPINKTTELAEIIKNSIPKRFWTNKIHPATRTFQAIRMEVNQELQRLDELLPKAIALLQPKARIAIITFHSREDHIVATFLKKEANPCHCPPNFPVCVCGAKANLRIINKKAIQATQAEIEKNPRSRSARLRVAEKI